MEKIQGNKVVSIGGLTSSANYLQLPDIEPGSALSLLNFESSIYGGYRRISGYSPLNASSQEVDAAGAEGRILVVAVFGTDIIVARKQQAGATYEFYKNDGATWTKYTTGLTRSSSGVTRIRWVTFNFNGTEKIVFVDGVNNACIFDGTNWTEIDSANTGADFANAGGNQAINAPMYVEVFKNHLFLAQDNLVAHSAPLAEYDFTAASGAGQLPVGFDLNQIKMFRDSLYVFGINNIKNISVSGSDFVVNEITSNIGCLASDTVLEVNGSLVFLSQDGIRPISGTDRINDIELETISGKIHPTIIENVRNATLTEVVSVLIRGKSQIRMFFSSPSIDAVDTYGIVGCIRSSNGSSAWEWGELKGFSVSCATSRYIGATEYVIHGDYDGNVFRQEVGNDFNGTAVDAVYSTPFLDFGDAGIRKTTRKVKLFVRPEGLVSININLVYDWGDTIKLNPNAYTLSDDASSSSSLYGTAIWDSSTYSGATIPILIENLQGSGHSVQFIYYTSDNNPPYTIQGALYEFSVEGRK